MGQKRIKSFLQIGMLGMLFTLLFSITALADTKITSAKLKITSHIEEDDTSTDVEVTSSSSRFEITDVTATNMPSGGWKSSSKPKLKITLEAKDGYYFGSSFKKTSVSLSGDDATVSSLSKSGKYTAYVTVTLADINGDYDLEPTNLEWEEDRGRATWDEAEDAKHYEVVLYRGSSDMSGTLTTTSETISLAKYFTSSGTYKFKVRAVRSSTKKGKWVTSPSYKVTASEAEDIYYYYSVNKSSSTTPGTTNRTSGGTGPGDGYLGNNTSATGPTRSTAQGAWLQDSNGWWYCNADRSFTVNDWQYINGSWYYFDSNGYMKTGWQYVKGAWYFLDNSGAMRTGWILSNGTYYYCDTNSGAMLHDTRTPDGYYVNSNGAWIQ